MNDCVLFVFAAAAAAAVTIDRPAGRCINCGVLQMNSGLCSRCIDMGQCIVCKRYLPPHCFEEVNVRICQVYRHFCANSFNQHQFLYHNPTPIAYTYLTTDCCLSVLQACSKKRKSPRITRAVDIIAEVQLPTTTTDTTFDSFIRRNTEQIMQIVNEHHQRHGCVICLSISNEI